MGRLPRRTLLTAHAPMARRARQKPDATASAARGAEVKAGCRTAAGWNGSERLMRRNSALALRERLAWSGSSDAVTFAEGRLVESIAGTCGVSMIAEWAGRGGIQRSVRTGASSVNT